MKYLDGDGRKSDPSTAPIAHHFPLQNHILCASLGYGIAHLRKQLLRGAVLVPISLTLLQECEIILGVLMKFATYRVGLGLALG